MIGDITRTGTYKKAILGNAKVAFEDKVVLDVGAGRSRSLGRPAALRLTCQDRVSCHTCQPKLARSTSSLSRRLPWLKRSQR